VRSEVSGCALRRFPNLRTANLASLAAARQGGIDRSRILNFMSRKELIDWATAVLENQD